MNAFNRMMREIYNVHDNITEAPPRLALQKFGGPFDIEIARKQQNVCAMVSPPFVSYCMLVEERLPMTDIGETSCIAKRGTVRGLRRPTNGSFSIADGRDLLSTRREHVYQVFVDQDRHGRRTQ